MTTATLAVATVPATGRAPLITRALLLRFVTIIGSSLGFYLPLSVVPMVAEASGSASAAGVATGALLAASIAGEVATPRLVARFGYRAALTGGLVLLGAPRWCCWSRRNWRPSSPSTWCADSASGSRSSRAAR